MKNLLVDTFFSGRTEGHGGDHRTAQIAELVEQANLQTTKFDRTLLKTRRDRIVAGLWAVLNPSTWRFIKRHQLNVQSSVSAIAFCGFQRKLYQTAFRQHTGKKILLWEATKNYVVPYVADENHFKVIAFPHNLEALVPGQDAIFANFGTEVAALAKATLVFCISREEEWLLRTKGVNAYYLPYYPPKAVLEKFLRVREARNDVYRSRFLIHGNANNPPTQRGMIQQLEWLKKARNLMEFQVDVVGFGTEMLKPYCHHSDFTLHGAVSPEQLHQFLVSTQAALIHQVPTSGALTRIPELLVAGIPVIANRNACRSTSDYTGVYPYDSWQEMMDWMSQPLETPELPLRSLTTEKQLIDNLVELTED